MQHICSSLVSIFALVTLKERKNIFGEARAPVNVCSFRNRLFCIRSDIHCENAFAPADMTEKMLTGTLSLNTKIYTYIYIYKTGGMEWVTHNEKYTITRIINRCRRKLQNLKPLSHWNATTRD